MNRRLLTLILLLFTSISHLVVQAASGLQVTNYSYADYHGGVQNWGFAYDGECRMYCANSQGLLKYDGMDWDFIAPSGVRGDLSDSMTLRAVHYADGKVYAAGDNNIGYWTRNAETGQLQYTSLADLLQKAGIKNDTFWKIASEEGRVYFQSFSNLVCYDGKQMEVIGKGDFFNILLMCDGQVFTQKRGGGLMIVREKRVHPFFDAPELAASVVRFLYKAGNGYVVGMADGSIYRLVDGSLTLITRIADETGQTFTVECGQMVTARQLAVGTLGGGVFILPIDGGRARQITTPELSDLNIHDLCQVDSILYIAHDGGVSSISLRKASYIWKSNADIGVFFDAVGFDGRTFVATNRGIYDFDRNGQRLAQNIYPLRFSAIKDELLCGSTTRLYRMKQGETAFQPMADCNGVHQFEYLASNGREFMFLNSYGGTTLLEYLNGSWQFRHYIGGTEDCKELMPEDIGTLWALASDGVLWRLSLSTDLSEVVKREKVTLPAGGQLMRMVKVGNGIIFASASGLFTYQNDKRRLERLDNLSAQIKSLDRLQFIGNATDNTLWVMAAGELTLYRIEDFQATVVTHRPYGGSMPIIYDGRYHVSGQVGTSTFVGTNDGTMVIDLQDNAVAQGTLRMEAVTYQNGKGETIFARLGSQIELPSDAHNIILHVATGLGDGQKYLSFQIEGLSDDWSSWQSGGKIQFSQLPTGNHRLTVRSDDGAVLEVDVKQLAPVYARWWMIVLYITGVVVIAILVARRMAERRQQRFLQKFREQERQKKEEKRAQKLKELQETARKQENDLKERMRLLTQKQDLLDNISKEVESQRQELGDRYPKKMHVRLMKLIQENATDKDRLLSFENYFVDVHHDFMLRMQEQHPDLSSGELKFCCLLRANLSTKEISDILGIGTRSVELRRYRLKQKLNLGKDDSLVSYILSK